MTELIQVLGNGYVRLVDWMGSDLSVVNAARASFAKEAKEMRDSDAKLIQFLAKHGHTSPFRHAFATFEIKAPLMVARQWWKYVVGADHTMEAWNEASRRYITMEPEFYIPSEWRSCPEDKKQGSGGPMDSASTTALSYQLNILLKSCLKLYEGALAAGVAPEQARLFLPAYGMHTVWRWSSSIQAICHFLNQRVAHDAQWEIQQCALAVGKLIQPKFPVCISSLTEFSQDLADHLTFSSIET
jgi:thymidylate synthase (FAD)